MSNEVRIVEAQTMKSLEDEIKAEEAALKAMTSDGSPADEPAEQVPVVDETPVTAPTPTVEPTSTPAPTPAATPAPTPDALRTAMAEKDAKIAELTKRIMDADGRRGGELSELRRQNEALSTKLEALMAKLDKAQSPVAPAPTEPEAEPLAEYDTAVKDGIRQLARREVKPIADALEQTKAELAAAKTEIAEAAKGSYETAFRIMEEKLEQAVPKFREYNVDPKFAEWLKQNFYTDVLNDAAAKLDLARATTIFRKYDAEQKTSPATETPVETPRGPVKPSKEAQVAVPAAGASPPVTPSPIVNINARVAELEKKLYSHRITPKESKELDDLYLQQAKSS